MKSVKVLLCVGILLPSGVSQADGGQYTLTNLGIPENAYSAIGVRMNNLGHVAGWSQYFGQGEPSLRGWVWTPADGYIMLESPPDMFLGRFRAMDISETGIVGGDLAWLWTGSSVTGLMTLIDFANENINLLAAHDINDAGQILALGFDNNVAD